jgi:ATP-binding cassette subfamily F protein 3
MLSKDVLKQALQDFDGTLLVVSHDREFLSDLTQRTIEFRDHKLTEYLGDVNYFLEKRKLDNMREVEMRTVVGGKPAANGGRQLSAEDKKLLQRTVQRTEKRIAELEKDIKVIETKMADPAFYTAADSQKVLKQYSDLKGELEKVYSEWETAVEQIA